MSRLQQISIHMFDYEKLQKNLESIKSMQKISDDFDYSEKLSQNQISESIDKKMILVASNIILPMVRLERGRVSHYFKNNLPKFIHYCEELDHLNYTLNPDKKYSYSNDTIILEKSIIKIKNKKMDPTTKQNILNMMELLMQHFQKMDFLIKRERSEVEDILFTIDDFESLKEDLYGTILLYVCIMIGLDRFGKRLVSRKTFETFVGLGVRLSTRLNKHTDNFKLANQNIFETVSTLKINKSELNSKKFITLSTKYQHKKIPLMEFLPYLNNLKIHLQTKYDVPSSSEKIFEDLAIMMKKILDDRPEIHKPQNSLDLKAIEYALALSEITPLKADVADSIHVILNLKS